MKLFAVLAGSITAMRVNTPVPGFVNEQGAFFADQSSDQSVQVPQQPQLPQVQPPHSTQAPQPGQEDADRDWPQGRQYPRGEGKGRTNEQGGWWPDQNGQDVGPVTQPPQPPQPPQEPRPIRECWESAQNAPNDVFMIKDNIQQCRLSNVMQQHVRLQLDWALKDQADEKKRELELAFTLGQFCDSISDNRFIFDRFQPFLRFHPEFTLISPVIEIRCGVFISNVRI